MRSRCLLPKKQGIGVKELRRNETDIRYFLRSDKGKQ